MQQLHLVGFTTDLDSLIFSARKGAKSGSFVLSLDEALLATIADAVRRRVADGEELEVPAEVLAPSPTPRRQSHLSPREIQDRLRAGRSLEAIAAEAGVGEEWVARFAAPVEAERSQIVGRARELVYAKPRRGESGEPLGLSVRWNLAERGIRLTNDEFDDCWSAYQIADHTWMVTFTFVSRKRTQEAEWEVDLATGELVGRGRLASDLGYVEPGRRRRSMASLQPMPLLGTKGARRIGAPAAANGSTAGPAGDDGDDHDEDGIAGAGARRRPASARGAAKRAPAKKAAASGRSGRGGAAAVARRPAKAAATKKKAVATPVRGSTAAAKRGAARPSAAKKAAPAPRRAATKKSAGARKAAPRRAGGRDVPPGSVAVAPVAEIERPVPNELSQRRLQLATGAPRPSGSGRPGPAGGAGVRARTSAPAPAPVRIAAARSSEVAPTRPAEDRRGTGTEAGRGPASMRERAAAVGPRDGGRERPPAVQAALDVADAAAAEARRAERRAERRAARAAASGGRAPSGARAESGDRSGAGATAGAGAPSGGRAASGDRAAAASGAGATAGAGAASGGRTPSGGRAASGAGATAGAGAPSGARAAGASSSGAGARVGGGAAAGASVGSRAGSAPVAAPAASAAAPVGDLPAGDGRVVTIRANRATPPRAGEGGEGDVVLPADRPPLRPAQPAAQPRRRRFGRGDR